VIGPILYCTVGMLVILLGSRRVMEIESRQLRQRYWQAITICAILWPVALMACAFLALIEAIIDYAEGTHG
jgi:hypothetical protein